MSNKINDGGPAFPVTLFEGQTLGDGTANGMTLREYAAIKLRVPESGTDWLDEMIRKSMRDEFAAKAMPIAWEAYDKGYTGQPECVEQSIAHHAYQIADAMLRARESK